MTDMEQVERRPREGINRCKLRNSLSWGKRPLIRLFRWSSAEAECSSKLKTRAMKIRSHFCTSSSATVTDCSDNIESFPIVSAIFNISICRRHYLKLRPRAHCNQCVSPIDKFMHLITEFLSSQNPILAQPANTAHPKGCTRPSPQFIGPYGPQVMAYSMIRKGH